MKILRCGERGHERPALLDAGGTLRDLSSLIEDWTPEALGLESRSRIAAIDATLLPPLSAEIRRGVPLAGIRKFIGIGMNYTDFAAEGNRALPAEPALFAKSITCLNGPDDPVMLPKDSQHSDWEVELAAVIGSTARYVQESEALECVAGYCLVNDLTERDYVNNRGGSWDKGKGCDTFGPVGPWLVTADELGDPQDVDLWLDVNGLRQQQGHTRNMIFPVAHLVAYVSGFMTLEPGDILTTGTPAGIGANLKPPRYLHAGDCMRLGSSKLGIQRQQVIAWSTP